MTLRVRRKFVAIFSKNEFLTPTNRDCGYCTDLEGRHKQLLDGALSSVFVFTTFDFKTFWQAKYNLQNIIIKNPFVFFKILVKIILWFFSRNIFVWEFRLKRRLCEKFTFGCAKNTGPIEHQHREHGGIRRPAAWCKTIAGLLGPVSWQILCVFYGCKTNDSTPMMASRASRVIFAMYPDTWAVSECACFEFMRKYCCIVSFKNSHAALHTKSLIEICFTQYSRRFPRAVLRGSFINALEWFARARFSTDSYRSPRNFHKSLHLNVFRRKPSPVTTAD